MNIRKAAAASGLTPDAIRYYERRRAVPAPPRRPNGYRHYTREHVAILRLAKGLRDLGLPLEVVGQVIPVAHDGTCGQLRGTLTQTLDEAEADVTARLRELRDLRRTLRSILRGLREMKPGETAVPGVAACACVDLVTGGQDPARRP